MQKMTKQQANRQKKLWQGIILALGSLVIGSMYLLNFPYSIFSSPTQSYFGNITNKFMLTLVLMLWSGTWVGISTIININTVKLMGIWVASSILIVWFILGFSYLVITPQGFKVMSYGHVDREYQRDSHKLLFVKRVHGSCYKSTSAIYRHSCSDTYAVGGQGPVFTLDPCYGEEALYLIKLRFGEGIRLPDEEYCAPRFYY